jgi:Flp pilus assembly protein, protease CpaA
LPINKEGAHILIYNIKLVLLFMLVLAALFSDIKTYKIKNVLIIFFVIAGVGLNTLAFGVKGLADCLLGTVLPFFLLILLFAARMLGAGDIKLFCAAGAIMGWQYILYCMAFSFMAGGVIALIIMLAGRNFIKRFKYLAVYLKSCFLTKSILSYGNFTEKNDGTKMRFSYAVTAGTFLCQLYIMI